MTDKDDKTLAMLAHILGIITGFLAPLIIWLIKKDQSEFIDRHGKEALNFQITLFIGYVIASVLTIVVIGLLLFPVLGILAIVFGIMAGLAANKGEDYRYPVCIRFIK